MKRKNLLFALLAALFMPWAANAQETLTVCDGTTTSSYAPIKSSGGSQTEFIYPASLLGDMEGGTITSVKFFSSSTSTTNYSNTVTVFVEEVASSTISASAWQYNQSTATKVYEGTTLSVTGGELVITFSTPYEYNGGNLCFNIWSADNTPTVSYYYLATTSSCAYDYYITPPVSVPYSTGNYLPKAEFTYTAASGTCEKPATLVAEDVTGNSATLTWTGGSGVYNIELNGTIIEENYEGYTYNLTDLAATTAYTAKVQSVCDGSTPTSTWKSVSFTTPCDAVTTFPWSENFENYSSGNFTDPCWVNEHISGNGTQIFKVYTSTNGSNSTHQLQLPDMTSGTMTKLRLPEMTLTTGDSYLFSIDVYRVNATSYTGEGIRVYASTDGEIEGATELAFISRNFGTGDGNLIPAESAAGWYTYELPIPFTGTCYIVLRGESKFGSSTYMDNFKVKKELPCVKPSAPTFVSSTTTSATLSWTNGAEGQTAWQIAYSTNPNFNPDEVTPVDVTSNPGTINGLTASTSYYAYVRANCGDLGYSEWSTAYCQFATACDVIPALGYTENFDSYTAGNNVLPNCWSYINTTTYSSYQVYPCVYANGSYSTYANSAPNCLYLYSYYSSYTSYDPQPQYAILPEMTGLAGKQVTLMAKGYSSTSTFKIGTMSDPTDASTFTMIAEQTLTTNYPEEAFEYIIPTNCTDSYLAIMIDAANSSRTSNGVYIDDIAIVEAPSCIKPTGLAVTEGSITNSGATITWTAGGDETNWQIEFATDADFTNPLYEAVEGEPTYTFHGLDDLTTYYVHVQAVCGGSDGSSEYCAPVSFTTLQAAANLPYSNDFESENGWVFVNGTRTNAWVYGEATNNGGTHALYISNDGGTTNAYSNSSAAMVYATKLFNFEAGTYVFSYDWKANGESNYDYLRVALVPSSVILTAGTIAPSVPSGSFYNNLPTGWIALDGGGKLNLKSDWQSFVSTEIEIATAGSYLMVFAWTDDTSGGTNPPAAIDNVSIEVVTCHTPTGLAVNESATTATSVELSWTENGEATAWQIELTDEEDNVEIIDANSNPFTLTELTPESMYAARVRAYCDEDNQSRWSEEVIFETAEECQMSDGLAAVATTNSAAISWNGYGQEEFNLRYSTDGTTWTTESRVANPYTLASLTPATTYQVQVQPTCADAETWSATYTFHTLCESIVVTDTWSEGFEDGVLSFCWDQDGDGTWTVGTGDGNTSTAISAHTGTYNAKITHNTNGNVTKLITPVLDLTSLNNPMLTFWYINRKWSNDIDGFAVYYRTASDAEWTQIYATEEAHETWTEASYVLPNPSATYQIAFEMTDGYGYGVGIDDVVIEEAPTYTKTITGYGTGTGNWYLIASPIGQVAPTAVTNMLSNTYDFYRFNQSASNEWENYKNSEHQSFSFEPGKGYLYANSQNVQLVFKGSAYTGNATFDLVYDADANLAGMNLVGNPFAETAYIADGRSFYTMQNNGTEILTSTSNSIELGEGVFVEAENADDNKITFTTTAPQSTGSKLALNLSNGCAVIDRAIVSFGEGRQLSKFQLNKNHTKVYIPVEGKDYAVVRAEEMGEMPVNFMAESNGTYSLSFSSENTEFAYLHLIDNLTGTDVDLLETPSYSFEASTTDYASRFKLVFATGSSTGSETFAFYSNGSFVINNEGNATLQVIDVMGRIVKSESVNGCTSVNVNAAPGVYMLRLLNGDNVKTQKVVVK